MQILQEKRFDISKYKVNISIHIGENKVIRLMKGEPAEKMMKEFAA